MQSHASRLVVSDSLKDLHPPDQSKTFPKEIIKHEIAEAYGRRGVQKLVDVLSLPVGELSDESIAHALRVFSGLLTTQENKLDAISAIAPLTRLVETSTNPEVLKLSCEAIGSLVQVTQGRGALIKCQGLLALTESLKQSPEAAAGAIRRFTSSNDGIQILSSHPELLGLIVSSFVALAERTIEDGLTIKAFVNATAALAGICTTDGGIVSSLENNVPAVIVNLLKRGLTGDLKFEANLNDLLEACVSCLGQICHYPEGRKAVREAGGVEVVASVLEIAQFFRPAQLAATAALMALSVERESKIPVMKTCGAMLVRLLKGTDDVELSSNAKTALISSSEHLEARRIMMINLLTEEEQKTLLGSLPSLPQDFKNRVLPG